MASKSSQELPKRDQGTFKTVMKCYEQKQYKKGLRSAEQILKKNPNHGETLAMKGLILNCLKRKGEAEQFAKKGLFANLKSHVCWHVYGLIHRSERRYQDAIKCYQNALKYDKDNLLILKDLSMLQIQRKDHDGFQETRRKILLLKSDQRINWIAYAVGNHLLGDYCKCLHILDTFIKTLDSNKVWDYQESEMFLYRNAVLQDKGDTKAALEDLNKIQKDVRDIQYVLQTKAKLYMQLGNNSKAADCYKSLLEINNENMAYHHGLQQAKGLSPALDQKGNQTYTPDQIKQLSQMYLSIAESDKYCSYAKRFPLSFTTGNQFREVCDSYMRSKLRKGVPSLFRELKALYQDPQKVATIESLVIGYYNNLKHIQAFSPKDPKGSETPNVLLWVIYYLASHYEFKKKPLKALELIAEGIEHTPTAIDLYVLKARTYKHNQDFQKAYEILNYARELDLADRYLNTKCVRYAFRAGKVSDAERIVKLFLRESDTLDTLFEMQAMWYELAAAKCHLKAKDYARALTSLYSVDKHFEDIYEDQFDFHTWCLRKTTLRAYVDMLRYQETLRGHRFFKKAGLLIVSTYVDIYDNLSTSTQTKKSSTLGEQSTKPLTAKERRALKKRQKRLAAKAKKREEAKKEAERNRENNLHNNNANDQNSNSQESQLKQRLKESIPDGKKLAADPKPLEAATKMVQQLQKYAPNDLETHLCAAKVYSRKNKHLLHLQAIKRALIIHQKQNSNSRTSDHPTPTTIHPELHSSIVSLTKAIRGQDQDKPGPADKESKALAPLIKKIFTLEAEQMDAFPKSNQTLLNFNDAFLDSNQNSLPHRTAAARVRVSLGASSSDALEAIGTLERLQNVTVTDALEAYKFINTLNLDEKQVTDIRTRLHAMFPLTPEFQPPAP